METGCFLSVYWNHISVHKQFHPRERWWCVACVFEYILPHLQAIKINHLNVNVCGSDNDDSEKYYYDEIIIHLVKLVSENSLTIIHFELTPSMRHEFISWNFIIFKMFLKRALTTWIQNGRHKNVDLRNDKFHFNLLIFKKGLNFQHKIHISKKMRTLFWMEL